MKRLKLLLVLITMVIPIGVQALVSSAKPPIPSVFVTDMGYQKTYALGETLRILPHEDRQQDEDTEVYAVLQKDKVVIAAQEGEDATDYILESVGRYELVYVAVSGTTRAVQTYGFSVYDMPYIVTGLNDRYAQGTEITFDAYGIYKSESVSASGKVTTPEGEIITLENSLILSETGAYIFEFSTNINGLNISKRQRVMVTKPVYSALVRNVSGLESVKDNIDSPKYSQGNNGIVVSGNAKETVFEFRNPIDMNTLNGTQNLIKLLPLSGGGYDPIDSLYVELVDAHNPSNVVRYFYYPEYYTTQLTPDWTYVFLNYDGRNLARRNDSSLSGTEVRSDYGAITSVHFDSSVYVERGRTNLAWVELQVDYPQKQFFVMAGAHDVMIKHMLLDLDNPSQVGLEKEWSGFEKGEAYLRVRLLTSGMRSGVMIAEAAGMNLSGEIAKDTQPPTIKTDYKTDYAVGVTNLKYAIPPAIRTMDFMDGITDGSRVEIKLKRQITLNAFEDVSHLMNAACDSFVPDKTGRYRIEYSIADRAGNIGILNKDFQVKDSLGAKSVKANLPGTAQVGTAIVIPHLEVEGMSDILTSEVKYYFGNKEVALTEGDSFLPDSAGVLKIQYQLQDYVGNELSGELECAVSIAANPVIKVDGMPMAAINGLDFILPSVKAVDYNYPETDDRRYPTVSVSINGKVHNGEGYKVTSADGNMLNISYSAGSGTKSYQVPIINTRYIDDYFLKEGVSEVKYHSSYTEFLFRENGEITLINPLAASDSTGVSIKLGHDTSKKRFESMDIILSDFYNADKSFFIRVSDTDGNITATLNGIGLSYNLSKFVSGDVLELNYDNLLRHITRLLKIDKYSDGSTFLGFSRQLFNLTFRLNGVKGESSLRIFKISNKEFGSTFTNGHVDIYEDFGLPFVIYSRSVFDNELAKGGQAIIPSASAWTVLSGMCSVIVNVTAPDGTILINNASAVEEHGITLSQYGTYNVRYTVTYAGGIRRNFYQNFTIRDSVPPVINVTQDLDSAYSVDSEITIPIYNVVTDHQLVKEYVYLISPDGTISQSEKGAKIKLSALGTYRIVIVAEDTYNISQYQISVKSEVAQG